ncbi:MAG: YlxR family protein [Actinobacteria bacterium]|nr:MAG: YlxR family protein [Actinomycetota bacterium]
MTPPIRSCIGCGRKAPQQELLRFVAENGRLVPGDHRPGRGAYTCRRLSCFERAASRRAFNRTLRQTVEVEPGLSGLYT